MTKDAITAIEQATEGRAEESESAMRHVLGLFNAIAEDCPYRDLTDCAHPQIEMDRMCCAPCNCPFLLRD